MLINGLTASFVGALFARPTVYFCGGGPREVLGGGHETESRIFNRLDGPNAKIERQLLRAVNLFDIVVTKGNLARRFFSDHGVNQRIEVIHGALDTSRFTPTDQPRTYDLVFVGRISSVKRMDIFLNMVRLIRDGDAEVSAVVELVRRFAGDAEFVL